MTTWKKKTDITSSIVKTTQSQNVSFHLWLVSEGLHHLEMYVLFQDVYCVWTGILHEAAGQPGQRLPRLPHQQKGQTETPCSYWWHWPTKEINNSRPPRLKVWSQWKSATTTELSVCSISLLAYVSCLCTFLCECKWFMVILFMKSSLILVCISIGSVNMLKTNT